MKKANVYKGSESRPAGKTARRSGSKSVENPSEISPADASEFLKRHTANLAKKLRRGETLPASQVNFLHAIQGEVASPVAVQFARNQTHLAAILGVHRKTIHRGMQLPGHPRPRADGRLEVAAWRTFLQGTGALATDDVDTVKEKARNLVLKNQKLEAENAILRKNWKPVEEIERWGAELGAAVRKVVCQIHRSAQSLDGLPTAEIEIRLKKIEDEILAQLNGLNERIESTDLTPPLV